MPGPGSAALPHAGAARRATDAGERAFGMKQKRGVAPAARPKMASARRVGIEDSPVPRPKRVKMTDEDVAIKTVTFAVKVPADAAQERFKKRLAAELDAICELVKKAEVLSRGKNGRSLPRPEAPVVASSHKEPPAKRRRKMSPVVEKKIHMDSAQQMSPEEGEIVVVPEEDEAYIDVCGGVSPVAIPNASPLVSLEEKAGDQSKMNIVPAEEQDEFVDICGGTPVAPVKVASEASSPMYGSNSGSSTSSDSDDDESVDSPAPEAVPPPKENNGPTKPVETVTAPASEAVPEIDPKDEVSSPALPDSPAQQPAPASSVMAQPEQNLSNSGAKELQEIRDQKNRRMLREMERAVLPDQTIHRRDLERVGIRESDYILEDVLGISLRPDV